MRGIIVRLLVVLGLVVLISEPAFAEKKGQRRSKKQRKAVPAKVEKKAAEEPPAAPREPAQEGGKKDEENRDLRRGERIEFDARLIQGQTAKAGAVYLFERASTNLRSMVKDRTSFRDRIIRMVFPTKENGS